MQNKTGTLFLTFLKIGAFSFGGGYAMIPVIREEIVNRHQWLCDEDMLEMIAVAESTPGPIAINAATFVGYRVNGFWGALASTLGVVLPSFAIIYLLSFVLEKFKSFKPVAYAFTGIRAGVLVLIFRGLVSMYKQSEKSLLFWILAPSAFLLSVFTGLNTVWILIFCAILGLIYTVLRMKKEAKS